MPSDIVPSDMPLVHIERMYLWNGDYADDATLFRAIHAKAVQYSRLLCVLLEFSFLDGGPILMSHVVLPMLNCVKTLPSAVTAVYFTTTPGEIHVSPLEPLFV